MIKFCKWQWERNHKKLEARLREMDLITVTYLDLVREIVEHVFNPSDYYNAFTFDAKKITEIDNGDYQGTLLFLIPEDTYQPGECEYLMTYIGYGSCSVCDTLQCLHDDIFYDYRTKVSTYTDDNIRGFMNLCKDIVQNTIRPYNHGWRSREMFEFAEEETEHET